MNILSVSRNHDASIAVVEEGVLVLHTQEERHSRIKKDGVPFWAVKNLPNLIKSPDYVCVSATTPPALIQEPRNTNGTFYDVVIGKLYKTLANWETFYFHDHHHLTHAANAFYGSGFDSAVCVIFDGGGSFFNINHNGKSLYSRERHSVFTAEYPAKFTPVYKEIYSLEDTNSFTANINGLEMFVSKYPESFGFIFTDASMAVGLDSEDAGKFMGMAAYGEEDSKIPSVYINKSFNPYFCNEQMISFLQSSDFQVKANFAYKVQKEVQERAVELILKAINMTGAKNVCLSGGYALNCTANYEFLKHLPSGVRLYVDPVAHDAGIAVGAAKYLWHDKTGDTTVRPLKSLYLGYDPELYIPKDVDSQKVSYADVAELIASGNIVSIYQGKSEAGPRALGNRSILFDPRHPDGKAIVNTVKGREWFRPFAGTVLKEKTQEWFKMRGLEESPFMTYAVEVKEEQQKRIPCIVHVDGSCRVQTVTEEQNQHYYRLIQAFESKTGVPILFNTSFNLAGDPMVETVEDAIDTLKRSKLEYLYLPELETLIKVPNENTY
jgi:carbamoyltransferase